MGVAATTRTVPFPTVPATVVSVVPVSAWIVFRPLDSVTRSVERACKQAPFLSGIVTVRGKLPLHAGNPPLIPAQPAQLFAGELSGMSAVPDARPLRVLATVDVVVKPFRLSESLDRRMLRLSAISPPMSTCLCYAAERV